MEPPAVPPAEQCPFFIVGSGRSGTTLLQLLLCGHSRLHIPPETWFLQPLVARFPLTGALSPEDAAAATETIVSGYRWPDMEIATEEFRAAAAALPSPGLADLVRLVYRFHLTRAGKPRFGDKTPPYIDIVPQLAELFPGARFIHLIRDGRDVAISFADAHWGYAYQGRRFEWTHAIRRGLSYRDTPYASQLLEVRYEDMVGDVAGTLRRICDFLGEAFEPEMLEWRERITQVPERQRYHHGKLARPISSDAIAVWRRKLSAAECFLLEASLRRDLDRLGYGRRFAGPLWGPTLDGAGVALRAMAPLLDRALPFLLRRRLLPRVVYL